MNRSAGGKARGLELIAQVVDVPPFLILPSDTVSAAIDDVAELKERLRASEVPPPWAVRSSADVEDDSHASFAGLFTTVLGVQPDTLANALRDVVSSGDSIRVREYAAALGRTMEQPARVHVIVQSLVPASAAGVCLSRTPETEAAGMSVVVIEAVRGLGETLVSGEVEPDRYYVPRDNPFVEVARVGNQVVEAGVSGHQLVPSHLRRARKLDDSQVLAVAEAALAVEKALGLFAVDIEWAFDSARLWILQARPVASLSKPQTVAGEGRSPHLDTRE